MSRYQELCSLAVSFTRQIREHNGKCRRLAASLILGYLDHLDCPREKVVKVELDRDLKPTDQVAPLTQQLATVTDEEGFVHFAWRISFDSASPMLGATELIHLSIRIDGDKARVREAREFALDPAKSDTWLPLFEFLYEESRTGFGSPLGRQSRRIGFTQGD